LLEFVRYFWPVLEPQTEFVDGWPLRAICDHLEAVTFGEINRLLMNVPPGFMKSLLTDVFWPAWMWGPMNQPHKRFVTFSYSASLTERDNRRMLALLLSPDFQVLWGERFNLMKKGETLLSNDKTGWKLASSVGGVGTGERGDVVIADDLHNVKEAESDQVRTETVRWFQEAAENRLNDLKRSAIVVIMQRVHAADVAGEIIKGGGYTHLCIPMEFEPARACNTKIGWTDPRKEDGELAWAERFPEAELLPFKRRAYMWCTPAEAPVLMRDLSMRPISEIKEGDEIIGWTEGDPEATPINRRSLTVATVKSISVSEQPLVKMTLESGAVIRCTPDHKWYTAKNAGGKRMTYAPASVGTPLMRICPDRIEELIDPGDLRLAGWLAGFFDGEGSAVLGDRGPGYPKRCTISFSQGDGRNLPLCEKLEMALHRFGFKFNYRTKARTDRVSETAANHSQRWYWINNGNGRRGAPLETFQRFLHVIRPEKWRGRMAEGALTSRFISSRDRVVSIEPDGVETVYGLETTTGNYVVWGLASSNSGQYQQRPEPRGGGIFKRHWWRNWNDETCGSYGIKPGHLPSFSYMLGVLDTAYTEKDENDPSAMTVWGVFPDPKGVPNVMLVHSWEEWLEFNPLVERTAKVAKDMHLDRLLIEAKASGQSVAQELARRFGGSGFSIEAINPDKGDKTARAYAQTYAFEEGLVWAPGYPDGRWRKSSERVIDQMATFPRSTHKDLTDTSTMALWYLRARGLLLRAEEKARDDREIALFRGRTRKLYDA
jgi:predicted phage terminase large subunit-like protein